MLVLGERRLDRIGEARLLGAPIRGGDAVSARASALGVRPGNAVAARLRRVLSQNRFLQQRPD
jgi:hypothetical protein